jgi:hypothetical protein
MKNRKREIRTSGSVRDEDGQHPHLLGRERIFAERLTHQRREPIASVSKIYRLGGHQHPYAGRNRDPASTARSTVCKVAASMPGVIRTVASPITISIDGDPPGHTGAIGISARGPASTITA